MRKDGQYLICRLDEIDSPGSVGFSIEYHGQLTEGFVVRTGDMLAAYQNYCPHTGANLNWMPGQFLTSDSDFIQCSIHGALFRLNDGLCVRGPCIGQKLQSIKISLEDGQVFADLCPV